MRNELVSIAVLFSLIWITLSLGCIDHNGDDNDDEGTTDDQLKLELFVNTTINIFELPIVEMTGERSVPISMKVSWDGSDNFTGAFPDGQEYEFIVRNETEDIWIWSVANELGFIQMIVPFSVNYTKDLYYNVTWEFKENEIVEGSYEVIGIFMGTNQTVSKEIEIIKGD